MKTPWPTKRPMRPPLLDNARPSAIISAPNDHGPAHAYPFGDRPIAIPPTAEPSQASE